MHIFPDGKKYVGCTGKPVRTRWDGGLAYGGRMLDAILGVGWENIRHYVLFENLDRETALLAEAALIRTWKTYRPSAGYNTIKPAPYGLDQFVVPKYRRRLVKDHYSTSTTERFIRRAASCADKINRYRVPVRLVETGEVFESVKAAAQYAGATVGEIAQVANRPNRTCGSVWIEDPDEGWRMEVRAHWEYVNNNEEKDDF